MSLLQKCPKYNLHIKPKNWIQNPALEAETTISHLPPSDRDVYRKWTEERISTLKKNPLHTHTHTQSTHPETKTTKSIKKKP
jgi:hypothetical protein